LKRGNFIKYFLLTYFFCLVPTATGVLPSETLSWKEKIIFTLIIPLGVSIVLAPIFYWLHPKLHRRHRRKKVKKKLFKTFVEKHYFKITDDGYAIGKIDDYLVFIHSEYHDFQSSKWIEIQVIFNPKQQNSYIPHSLISRLIRKYNEKHVSWFMNSVFIKQQYGLKMPSYEKLYPLLKKCISELKANHIEPISYLEWQQMLPETQTYIDKIEKS